MSNKANETEAGLAGAFSKIAAENERRANLASNMSKQEYMATAALMGLCAGQYTGLGSGPDHKKEVASTAVGLARALIEALESK